MEPHSVETEVLVDIFSVGFGVFSEGEMGLKNDIAYLVNG